MEQKKKEKRNHILFSLLNLVLLTINKTFINLAKHYYLKKIVKTKTIIIIGMKIT